MSSVEQFEAEVRTANSALEAERKRLSEALGRLKGIEQAVIDRSAREANAARDESLSRIAASGNPEALSWSHSMWDGFQPGTPLVARKLRIGSAVEELINGEEPIDLPFTIPLMEADGPILLLHDKSTEQAARTVLQTIAFRSALLMTNQLRLTLLDPNGMGAAFPFRGFLGRDVVRSAGRNSADELSEVVDDIRRINERVIGDADRVLSLSAEQRSGESFEIIAAAGFPSAYAKDPRAMEHLVRIANAGPRAGRHLVLEWNKGDDLPHGFDPKAFSNAHVIDLTALDRAESGLNVDGPNGIGRCEIDAMPDGSRQKELIENAFAGAKSREGGDWNAIVRPEIFHAERSVNRVETPIGERLKFWLGESDDGKQSAHAMLAGQVGSGKSYLLHVLILGLAARYSPEELKLTLIDGKQGVEFEAYRNLPHADVVCLRTAPALARSVLADYVAEMDSRYELFQAENVVKLADYRAKSHTPLPRCVLVVDEYQQILDGDPETGSLLLGRLLEKGRAAGMHVVLGSQTFEQRGLPTSALSHIHTWAALSLAESYSQSIQVFGSEGKRLIRDLSAMAEVVLNDEGGRDGANARGAVARLRTKSGEDLLPGILEEIIASAPDRRAPIVLSGREGALISENVFVTTARPAPLDAKDLQDLARTPLVDGGFGLEVWNASDRPVPLWFGRRFDVRGHALVPVRRAPGQNVLILGNQAETRCRMLALGLAALGAVMKPDDLEVYFLDGLRSDMPGGDLVKTGLEKLAGAGFKVHPLDETTFIEAATDLQDKCQAPDPSGPTRLLVISDPDYLYSLHVMDRFNIPADGAPALLRHIIQRGPQAGIHTLMSASGLSSFQLILSPTRDAQQFNHRIVQPMNEDESMTLFSSLTAARLSDRADHPFSNLYVDQQLGARNAVLFHAYAGHAGLNKDQGLEAVKDQLALLQYPGTS